jgi:exodeoxyribonuclease V beta subunit
MSTPRLFDLGAPLDTGLLVLEASAGTGKTFAVAGLATRWIAERGIKASELCIVTFSTAATAELRKRVRDRIVEAAAFLEELAPNATAPDSITDSVLVALASNIGERGNRIANLHLAVADFDAATISTIHGFCNRVLASGGESVDGAINDDNSDITELVVDELIRRYGSTGKLPSNNLTVKKLVAVVNLRVKMPHAQMWKLSRTEGAKKPGLYGWGGKSDLTPAQFEQANAMDEIALLVDELVALVHARRVVNRVRTYDSLLTDTQLLLSGPKAPVVIDGLRSWYRVVLLDEFQDTDRVQWDIFERAFVRDNPVLSGGTGRPDVIGLVGDPKQSIYRFRSAELSAYLTARKYADDNGGTTATLGINWRSDKAVLTGLDHLFHDYSFGDARVAFQSVEPSPDHNEARISNAGECAVEIRCLPFSDVPAGLVDAKSGHVKRGKENKIPNAPLVDLAIKDLVGQVLSLLSSARLHDKPDSGEEGREVDPSDIGIIVRSNRHADLIADALAEAGVPCARSASDSVLNSAAAEQWRVLLEALERPASEARIRSLCHTWFIGDDLAAIAAMTDTQLEATIETVRDWAQSLVDGGLPSLMATLRRAGLLERVLSLPGGERDLTDLDHIVELMQSLTGGRPTAASALRAVFAELSNMGGADDDGVASELLARRIDRDDDTVKIMTVHKAKGLEFSIVLCPLLWGALPNRQGTGHAHDESLDTRLIDTFQLLGANSRGVPFQLVEKSDKGERLAESDRMLYVALTRAKHRLVVWWTAADNDSYSVALGRVMSHAIGAGGSPADVTVLAERSNGSIARREVTENVVLASWSGTKPSTEALAVSSAPFPMPTRWKSWSFSSISSGASSRSEQLAVVEDALLADDVEIRGGVGDDHDDAIDVEVVNAALVDPVDTSIDTTVNSSLVDAPAGTAFGLLVHEVFEVIDFTPRDDRTESVTTICAQNLNYRPMTIEPGVLASGIDRALSSPLGGPVGTLALESIDNEHRLNELRFEFPLGAINAAQIAQTVIDAWPEGNPLHNWFVRASEGALSINVEGMLNGSIDLIASTELDGIDTYWVADYKTNRLTNSVYDSESLTRAMEHHGYGLQALLYTVALHRYLRWRLASKGYDPATQLRGAAYLFVRGMAGSEGPEGHGVFWWQPPFAVIEAVDQLLAPGVSP